MCPSGPTELLEDGQYGRLVPVGDDDALANAILSVLHDPPDREGLRGRVANFAAEKVADQCLDVITALCRSGRCGATSAHSGI